MISLGGTVNLEYPQFFKIKNAPKSAEARRYLR
jgi:hypothetical protein